MHQNMKMQLGCLDTYREHCLESVIHATCCGAPLSPRPLRPEPQQRTYYPHRTYDELRRNERGLSVLELLEVA
jgi:hypothetical protein